ncbi:MAG: adenylate/guanylate cyclase domain-containing protein [Nitrospinales bacterium]
MSYSSKIFLGFFILLTSLTGLILYLTHHQTEEFETNRISERLIEVQTRLHEKITSQQQATLKLVKTITLDQKFKSFLAQIKDNFYSFTEEIAADTGANIVFMVDEEKIVRGIFPPTGLTKDWIIKSRESFNLEDPLNKGKESAYISSIEDKLFSAISVPLKESFSDDYALGVVVVANEINDAWLKWLLGQQSKGSHFRAIFFVSNKQVAGNAKSKLSNAVMQNLNIIPEGSGTFIFSGQRYITQRGSFEAGENGSGFIYLSNLDKSLQPIKELQNNILIVGLLVLLVGLGFSIMFSRGLVKPLNLILAGTRKIAAGDYDFQIQNKSSDVAGKLSEAFNKMVRELKEKKSIQDTFGKYVHPSIVENMLADPEKLKLGGDRRIQTIMFTDIAGFTSISEKMPAETLVSLLNQFLGAMTEVLTLHEGILDQHSGDGFTAFWGPPFTKGNHAKLACTAALKMQQEVKNLATKLSEEGFPHIKVRIGLASGNMIVGNIGSDVALTYTCLGDTVNYGSRLEGLNKHYGTEIIIGYFVYSLIGESFIVRELDTIQVKGRQQGETIFELVSLKEEVIPEQLRMIKSYEDALNDYRSADFHSASQKFLNIVEEYSDKASQIMNLRCNYYIENPPENWAGIHIMTEK